MNITIERAVLEQALEALNHGITEMNHRGCAIECMSLHHATKAIREELAQPQPVQEPEAYAVYWGIGKMRRDSVHLELETAQAVASEIKSATEIKPLYTSPQAQPVPPAQPLSDEQINRIHASIPWDVNGLAFGVALARAVEAAHSINKPTA